MMSSLRCKSDMSAPPPSSCLPFPLGNNRMCTMRTAVIRTESPCNYPICVWGRRCSLFDFNYALGVTAQRWAGGVGLREVEGSLIWLTTHCSLLFLFCFSIFQFLFLPLDKYSITISLTRSAPPLFPSLSISIPLSFSPSLSLLHLADYLCAILTLKPRAIHAL